MPYFERAYRGYLQEGKTLRAAFVATWIAHDQKNNLQTSVANGWMSRAKRLLDLEDEAAEHGYWALQKSLVELSAGNFAEALPLARKAEELGRRFGDRNLEIRGLQRQGNVADRRRARSPRASSCSTRPARPRSPASSTLSRR